MNNRLLNILIGHGACAISLATILGGPGFALGVGLACIHWNHLGIMKEGQ